MVIQIRFIVNAYNLLVGFLFYKKKQYIINIICVIDGFRLKCFVLYCLKGVI